jgi:hypothetical protein
MVFLLTALAINTQLLASQIWMPVKKKKTKKQKKQQQQPSLDPLSTPPSSPGPFLQLLPPLSNGG